jgi:hypothetical protein
MAPTWNRLGRGNVSVRVNEFLLFGKSGLSALEGLGFLWVRLIHDHTVRVRASRDDHSGVGTTFHNSTVIHNILREVLVVASIGILKLRFTLYDSWGGGKIIATNLALVLSCEHLKSKRKW